MADFDNKYPLIGFDWAAWVHTPLFGGYVPQTRLRGGEYNKFPLQRRYPVACGGVLHCVGNLLEIMYNIIDEEHINVLCDIWTKVLKILLTK
jgi:hypothetical protein